MAVGCNDVHNARILLVVYTRKGKLCDSQLLYVQAAQCCQVAAVTATCLKCGRFKTRMAVKIYGRLRSSSENLHPETV
jgi:hypothetical protein